jgi:hypothetical protein
MKMSAYALAIGLVFGSLTAHADGYPQNPQQQQQLPQPIDQFPPDQSVACPPNVNPIQCAPPVLPYPGPQVRAIPIARPLTGVCTVQSAGGPMGVILLNGMQVLYGPAVYGNIQAVLVHYQRIGVCQPVF